MLKSIFCRFLLSFSSSSSSICLKTHSATNIHTYDRSSIFFFSSLYIVSSFESHSVLFSFFFFLLFTSHPPFFLFPLRSQCQQRIRDSQSIRRHRRPRRRRRLFVVTIKHSLTFLYTIYMCTLSC
jgi:hypothetical protein